MSLQRSPPAAWGSTGEGGSREGVNVRQVGQGAGNPLRKCSNETSLQKDSTADTGPLLVPTDKGRGILLLKTLM